MRDQGATNLADIVSDPIKAMNPIVELPLDGIKPGADDIKPEVDAAPYALNELLYLFNGHCLFRHGCSSFSWYAALFPKAAAGFRVRFVPSRPSRCYLAIAPSVRTRATPCHCPRATYSWTLRPGKSGPLTP